MDGGTLIGIFIFCLVAALIFSASLRRGLRRPGRDRRYYEDASLGADLMRAERRMHMHEEISSHHHHHHHHHDHLGGGFSGGHSSHHSGGGSDFGGGGGHHH